MENFKFKKQYGQNFISDKNLLKAIVCDAEVQPEDEVLEIGPGAGSLTFELASVAKKVVAIEIDKTLKEILEDKLSSMKNVDIVFNDVMKMDMEEIENNFDGRYKIVANLPYYITTPIMFKFLENTKMVESLTVMVQKEVAERICAKTKQENYGVLSIMCDYYAETKIKRIVGRNMFYPIPNVDSAIVHLKIRPNLDFEFSKKVYKVVQSGFLMRRKTLVNNFMKGLSMDRTAVENLLDSVGIFKMARAEDLSLDEWKKLTDKIDL